MNRNNLKKLLTLDALVPKAMKTFWANDKPAHAWHGEVGRYWPQRALGNELRFQVPVVATIFLALNAVAAAATISFNTDPLQGTNVRNLPGRQVVGGEPFVSFNIANDVFVFDETAFGMGNQVRFANGLVNAIATADVNVVVLQTTDNDDNPLTPFGAGNAADLLAGRIVASRPGVFIYFNSALNLARLVYSDDLGSNTADLKIFARMVNVTGQAGIDALPTFAASNFAIADLQAVPEPSAMLLMSWGIALIGFSATLHRFRN